VEGSPGQRLENFGFFLAVHMMKGQTERFVVSGFFTVNVF